MGDICRRPSCDFVIQLLKRIKTRSWHKKQNERDIPDTVLEKLFVPFHDHSSSPQHQVRDVWCTFPFLGLRTKAEDIFSGKRKSKHEFRSGKSYKSECFLCA